MFSDAPIPRGCIGLVASSLDSLHTGTLIHSPCCWRAEVERCLSWCGAGGGLPAGGWQIRCRNSDREACSPLPGRLAASLPYRLTACLPDCCLTAWRPSCLVASPASAAPPQLNIYGFHKTRHEQDSCEFKQPNFKRGQRHLLGLIRRRGHNSGGASTAGGIHHEGGNYGISNNHVSFLSGVLDFDRKETVQNAQRSNQI